MRWKDDCFAGVSGFQRMYKVSKGLGLSYTCTRFLSRRLFGDLDLEGRSRIGRGHPQHGVFHLFDAMYVWTVLLCRRPLLSVHERGRRVDCETTQRILDEPKCSGRASQFLSQVQYFCSTPSLTPTNSICRDCVPVDLHSVNAYVATIKRPSESSEGKIAPLR
jgi:hypothetical protein